MCWVFILSCGFRYYLMDSLLILSLVSSVRPAFSHRKWQWVSHTGKWLRLILAGSPNPDCLPRELRASMALILLLSLPFQWIIYAAHLPGFLLCSFLCLKRQDTLHRPLAPMQLPLQWISPFGQNSIALTILHGAFWFSVLPWSKL